MTSVDIGPKGLWPQSPQARGHHRLPTKPKEEQRVADGKEVRTTALFSCLQLSEVSDGCFNLNLGGDASRDAGDSGMAAGVDDTNINLIDTARKMSHHLEGWRLIWRRTCNKPGL